MAGEIEGIAVRAALPPSSRGVAASKGAGAFRVSGDPGGFAQAAVASAAPDALGAVLLLDAEAERDRRNGRARQRGLELLDALAAVQRAMLDASGAGQALDSLEGLLAGVPDADDPGLAALLGQIILRARVQLALHERTGVFGQPSTCQKKEGSHPARIRL